MKKKFFLSIVVIISVILFATEIFAATLVWQNVGNPGFSTIVNKNLSMAMDGSTPYVVYNDRSNANKATVMRYNGVIWEVVGTAGFSAGEVDQTSIALAGSTPYVAYRDVANGSKPTVMRFDGTSWETVGTSGFSAGSITYLSFALGDGVPYVAYRDLSNAFKATVMKFNGTDWVVVGTVGFSDGVVNSTSLAFNGSTPYVAFSDETYSGKAVVMRFNGSDWEKVGSPGFSAGIANSMKLALDGSTPYVVFRDGNDSYKATVMRYIGTSWQNVGSSGFSSGTVFSPSLAMDGSTPYVAFQDVASSKEATAMKYNGTSWEVVGKTGFSDGGVGQVNLALNDSTPYVAFRDWVNGYKATVMKYDLLPPSVTTTSPGNGATITSIDTLTVNFDRDMLHDGSEHAANKIENYLLVEANGDGFQTTTCKERASGNDIEKSILSANYENNSGTGPYRVVLKVDPLEVGEYKLLVCGSASIHDTSGNVINGGTDTQILFTISPAESDNEVKVLPQTGFAPGVITKLPSQSVLEKYQLNNYVLLTIPALNVNAPIVGVPFSQGEWNLTWLGNQAGWLHGTAFPSWAGNSVITAHVVDADGNPGLFSNLKELKWGEKVIVHAFGQDYVYEVREIEKYLQPNDTSYVFENEEYPYLTLITCRGYDETSDTYSWRVAVKAVQTGIR